MICQDPLLDDAGASLLWNLGGRTAWDIGFAILSIMGENDDLFPQPLWNTSHLSKLKPYMFIAGFPSFVSTCPSLAPPRSIASRGGCRDTVQPQQSVRLLTATQVGSESSTSGGRD